MIKKVLALIQGKDRIAFWAIVKDEKNYYCFAV